MCGVKKIERGYTTACSESECGPTVDWICELCARVRYIGPVCGHHPEPVPVSRDERGELICESCAASLREAESVARSAEAVGEVTLVRDPHVGGGLRVRVPEPRDVDQWVSAAQSSDPNILLLCDENICAPVPRDRLAEAVRTWIRSVSIPELSMPAGPPSGSA
jgi:hypothetical protein